ncbi:hypothetical protein TPHA_0D00510 [Tetrapisispora phaffii CBS 4417]|uniref:Fcf2 pre-rRNA processing C-terminal domain-containing protein n=1 Tax=Tetrapisispora phaffii (strain ATCC 24235 / CBS 4417 / NBRC 1672 / NRRL Y-8282 / UCD 70-5) TaxID=1071381 RepID=G8BS74_TETPH|nr:hypothetical protein TPHA_0D00510 [Tetrapisispora phaffii CBS 4417]CCE62695.1 hypothetical protein TPHA_0D00510 [Tetrapisispora phaffii CBS 4417]
MDKTVEDLFKQLKEASKTEEVNKNGNGTVSLEEEDISENKDVLQLDDDSKDTEKEFEKIEKNLRQLPKLQNEFDQLSKVSNNDEKKHEDIQGKKAVKLENREKSARSTTDWFTMPKVDSYKRDQVQRDLLLLKHRSALDPKRHYKKDKWKVPDRFSVGTIVEDKTEFFSSRMTNKQRKSTMLETLMADDDSNKYFKRKYAEIQDRKTSGKKGHYKKIKEMRKRK